MATITWQNLDTVSDAELTAAFAEQTPEERAFNIRFFSATLANLRETVQAFDGYREAAPIRQVYEHDVARYEHLLNACQAANI